MAESVEEYLSQLPAERRHALTAVREVMTKNMDPAFAEGISYGMISYGVPHSLYPAGYHVNPKVPLPFASLASQKHHMALYLMCIYSDSAVEERFRAAWAKSGKKLDMGKSCIRFRKLDDLALDAIAEVVRSVSATEYIAHYEAVRAQGGERKAPRARSPAKKTPAKKTPAKKTPAKKTPAKKTPAKKTPAKKTPAKKTPAKKTSAKRATKQAVTG